MLIDGLVEFLKDRLRNAVMFALFSLLAFYVWWDLKDEGSLVAGVVFAGVSAQQAYRYFLTKQREKPIGSNETDGNS